MGGSLFGIDPGWLGGLAKGVVNSTAQQPNFLNKLFGDKFFLQMLGAAGSDLMEGKGAQNTLAALTKNIAGGSFSKILGDILGGKMPGSTAKVDDKGLTINSPRAIEGGATTSTTGAVSTPATSTTPAGTSPQQSGTPNLSQLINMMGSALGGQSLPFADNLSRLSASDLAGLGPEEIAQALHIKGMFDQQGTQALGQMADTIYKQGLLQDYAEQRKLAASGQDIERTKVEIDASKEIRAWAQAGAEAPLEVPGLGKLTMDQWEKLPVDTKAYSYYAFQAAQQGKEVMDFNEWKNQPNPPQIYEIYKLSLQDPKFKKFAFEYQKSGASNINLSPFEQTRQRELAQSQADVMSPDFHTKTIKQFDEFGFDNAEAIEGYAKEKGLTFDVAASRLKNIETLKSMDAQIRQAFEGHAIELRKDGWYVDGVRKVRNPYGVD